MNKRRYQTDRKGKGFGVSEYLNSVITDSLKYEGVMV